MATQSGITVDVQESIRSFRVNESEWAAIFNGKDGAVAKELTRRAIKIHATIVNSMGHSEPPAPPGTPPAVRTGRLQGSITWRLGTDWHGVYVDIGTNVFYAPFVELGTSRMAPRPFLVPALESARATGGVLDSSPSAGSSGD